MKTKRGYFPAENAFPFGGLDTTSPPTQIEAGSSPNNLNLTTFRGTLKKREGYSLLGATTVGTENILSLFNFQTTAGTNYLVSVTATKIWRWNGSAWTDISPVGPSALFSVKSAGNGWDNTFAAGDFLKQAVTGATGQYVGTSGGYYVVAVTRGIFSAIDAITGTAGSSGTLSVSGTDPHAATVTLRKFPVLASDLGWSQTLGNFNVGDTVVQATSAATGVFYPSDASFYYIKATSGTFDDQDDITNTTAGREGTLSFTGTVDVATAATTFAQMPKLTGVDGWYENSDPTYGESSPGANDGKVGKFTIGDAVTQATSGATGVWANGDSHNFYIKTSTGTFDNTHNISTSTAVLRLSGTVPTVAFMPTARFVKASWSVVAGGIFNVGDSVYQATTGAIGVWYTPDGTYYYVMVTSGAVHFGDKDDVTNTTAGVGGTLTHSGATPTAVPTTTFHAVPTGTALLPRTASAGNFIDHDDGADGVLGKVVVLTNGKDWPVYWTGSGTFKPLIINDSTFCSAKVLIIHTSYLVFSNVTTETDVEPRSAIWSDAGNFTEWLLGSAGVLTEMNFTGEILRMVSYTNKIIVFSRGSIGCLCYVDPDVVFGVQIYVTGLEIVGAKSICFLTPFIGFVGQENIYIWDGGVQCNPIGDAIANKFRSLLSATYADQTQFFFDPAEQDCKLVLQTGASAWSIFTFAVGVPNFRLLWRDPDAKHRDRWFETSYADSPRCFGTMQKTTGTNDSVLALMGSSTGRVLVFDGTVTDAGTAITSRWDTGDFTVPQIFQSQFARWIEMEFAASGTTVDTYYSIDQGANWTAIDTTVLGSTETQHRVLFDVVSRIIRFRFQTTGDSFTLTWYRGWLQPGGAR